MSASSSTKHHRRLIFLLALTAILSLTYIASLSHTLVLPRREHFDAVRNHLSALVDKIGGSDGVPIFGSPSGETRLRYEDGLAYVEQLGSRHPMEELFELGRRTAAEVQDKSDTVRQGGVEAAVKDYKKAFGMDPPEGFDVWYVPLLLP